MSILFCNIGWSEKYDGDPLDKPKGGGSHNETGIGHEIYNFKPFKGECFGYVQTKGSKKTKGTIHIEKLTNNAKINKNQEQIDNVLVVWVATKPNKGGRYIIGWYKNATVYRKHQSIPNEVMQDQDRKKEFNSFFIRSHDFYLLPIKDRTYPISKGTFGQNNVWYGNENINKKVEEYIKNNYKYKEVPEIENLDTDKIYCTEREAIFKARIGQSEFRDKLIKKYKKCCLCGIENKELLIASHLKPWRKSNDKEKLDINNGLLLCPTHDKLIDKGLITFSENGDIIISELLTDNDKKSVNVNKTMKIKVNDKNRDYINYHRENIFRQPER